jgi:hypothetical protein
MHIFGTPASDRRQAWLTAIKRQCTQQLKCNTGSKTSAATGSALRIAQPAGKFVVYPGAVGVRTVVAIQDGFHKRPGNLVVDIDLL